jgi:hypothetical protein
MPRSFAKWFRVPSGSTPKRTPLPTMHEATALMVPSPPPAATISAPFCSARRAVAIISSPSLASTSSASRPAARSLARSSSAALSSWPWPAPPLTITVTGFFITAASCPRARAMRRRCRVDTAVMQTASQAAPSAAAASTSDR